MVPGGNVPGTPWPVPERAGTHPRLVLFNGGRKKEVNVKGMYLTVLETSVNAKVRPESG